MAFIGRGRAWFSKEEYTKAVVDYTEAIRLDSKSADAFFGRGTARHLMKEYEKAIADYRESIRLNPKYSDALSNLASILSTCPRAKYRDGKLAVELATQACELTEWKDVIKIDVLACAYAEAGDFEKAMKYEKTAIERTDLDNEDNLDERRERLKLFEQKKPYHETERID